MPGRSGSFSILLALVGVTTLGLVVLLARGSRRSPRANDLSISTHISDAQSSTQPSSQPPSSPATSPATSPTHSTTHSTPPSSANRAAGAGGSSGQSGLSQSAAVPVPAKSLTDIEVKDWHTLAPFELPLAQLPTVFWEPDDTVTLRAWIAAEADMKGKRVLEIGPGTGLVSLCCLQAGADQVVAVDINPYAVINTSYNADRLGLVERLDVRQVASLDASPFALMEGEDFDYIISNPPWEDEPVESLDQYALYDPGMRLCQSLLAESRNHLKPGGKLILVYGARTALTTLETRAPQLGWQIRILDARPRDQLPEVFVPGVMLELRQRPRT
ncbi:MAG: class I SAM-dependent methyltransferase [Pirellulaceae bacterium]|nr:class I SAM-dependent methyltransferase [Pirellulaceae bacterium]